MYRFSRVLISLLLLLQGNAAQAQIEKWRVGGETHPWNISPVSGRLEWGSGWAVELVDDDERRFTDGAPLPGATAWLAPVRLDSTRNLSVELNRRYLRGEFGGIVPGRDPRNPYMVIPSEYGFRSETADPFSSDFEARDPIPRADYARMVDGDPFTAFGSAEPNQGGIDIFLKGFFYINRVRFYPRPTLPTATMTDYIVYYGDPTNIVNQTLRSQQVLVPQVRGESNPPVKDHRFDPPVLLGRIDIVRRVATGTRIETAEAEVYGEGFPLDARYTSEIIDVGPPDPRVRRYSRQVELFSLGERNVFEQEFPEEPGALANWGRVRWRGRRLGEPGSKADVRIQFRAGNSLDTHLYARRLGPGLTDTRDAEGNLLDAFAWANLISGRVEQVDLQYNELGVDLGPDRRLGWSYWSAPFRFDEGLIPEDLPPEEWSTVGVPLPLPGGTRYLQFRILFDSEQHASTMFDFIEFEYAAPLVSGGVQAEIYPTEANLGEETAFQYYLKPSFAAGETTQFNRLEIDVPSLDTRIENLKFDFQEWEEIAAGVGEDPLLGVEPQFTNGDQGQFTQATVQDPRTGGAKLLIKLPPMGASLFRFGEHLEIVLTTRLFRGSHEFSSLIWNDQISEFAAAIPQPVTAGAVTPEVASDALTVVAERIGKVAQLLEVSPNPFTPDGDGINDQVYFTLDLFLVMGQIGVELEIFDLSGRVVYRSGQLHPAGRMELSWDGRDTGGQRVPPGLYLYRLQVDSDAKARQQTGVVSLIY